MCIEEVQKLETITDLLTYANKHNASDLHLSAGMPATIRVDGDIRKLQMPAMTESQVKDCIHATMNETQRLDFTAALELDYAFNLPNLARYRVNAFHQHLGLAAVFRHIPSDILSFEQLGLEDIGQQAVFHKIANLTQGLVLITGPTGSGKSTTLATLINHINETRPAHILTIEDPIEFIHNSKQSLINQREVHHHTLSFDSALKSALREDPDVILVGELRDLQTIRLALTAAETGHLVFATLHTRSATKTIDRVIDVFPASEKEMIRTMLSESLQAVVSQVLIKKIEGGRIAAHEIMFATPAIRHLIRENKLPQMYSAIQTGAQVGMITMDAALKNLVLRNKISRDSAQRYAKQPETFNSF